MIRHFFTKQFVLFLVAGGTAASVNWLSRIVLNIWIDFSTAVVIAYGFGMITAFILNAVLVFPNSDRSREKQLRDFILINLFSFPIVWGTSLALNNFITGWGYAVYSREISHGIAVAMPTFLVFLLYKFVAFRQSNAHSKKQILDSSQDS